MTYVIKEKMFKHILKAVMYFDMSTPSIDIKLKLINFLWEKNTFD